MPLWSIEDVKEWVKQVGVFGWPVGLASVTVLVPVLQIGFSSYCQEFDKSRVDGDLLLQVNEQMLRDDIGIKNGILRKRFMRELDTLKQITDYSSCDATKVYGVLSNLGQVYTKYTYSLLQCGVDRNMFAAVTDDMLLHECNIVNSVHRRKILETAEGKEVQLTPCH